MRAAVLLAIAACHASATPGVPVADAPSPPPPDAPFVIARGARIAGLATDGAFLYWADDAAIYRRPLDARIADNARIAELPGVTRLVVTGLTLHAHTDAGDFELPAIGGVPHQTSVDPTVGPLPLDLRSEGDDLIVERLRGRTLVRWISDGAWEITDEPPLIAGGWIYTPMLGKDMGLIAIPRRDDAPELVVAGEHEIGLVAARDGVVVWTARDGRDVRVMRGDQQLGEAHAWMHGLAIAGDTVVVAADRAVESVPLRGGPAQALDTSADAIAGLSSDGQTARWVRDGELRSWSPGAPAAETLTQIEGEVGPAMVLDGDRTIVATYDDRAASATIADDRGAKLGGPRAEAAPWIAGMDGWWAVEADRGLIHVAHGDDVVPVYLARRGDADDLAAGGGHLYAIVVEDLVSELVRIHPYTGDVEVLLRLSESPEHLALAADARGVYVTTGHAIVFIAHDAPGLAPL